MPGTTKNGEGRVFPLTDDLRALLEAQQAEHLRLRKSGQRRALGVLSDGRDKRGGEKHPRRIIRAFTKAWKAACVAAGLPGPHSARPPPHGGAQHGPARRAGARRDAAHRTQDAVGVRALQHRERMAICETAARRSCTGLTGTKMGQSTATRAPSSEGETLEIC